MLICLVHKGDNAFANMEFYVLKQHLIHVINPCMKSDLVSDKKWNLHEKWPIQW